MRIRYAITFFLTVLSSTLFAQTFRYVKPVATGSGDGTTWADASADLQGMINASATGDEVWVAAGTYKPTEKLQDFVFNTTSIVGAATTDRDKAFILKGGVRIYGGYNGTTGVRDIAANITILSGDLNSDNVASDGDSYHVVSSRNTADGAILDGFTIQHGYANGAASVSGSGTDGKSSLTVLQSTGGAIAVRGGNNGINWANLIIKNNYALTYAGAVAIYTSLTMETSFTNVQFLNNTSGADGGAMRVYASSGSPKVNLTNTKFFDNATIGRGGAIYAFAALSTPLTVTIVNSLFYNNSATSATTGGGAISVSTSTTCDVLNTTFYNNVASNATGVGGGIHIGSSASCVLKVSNTVFNSNTTGAGTFGDIAKGSAAPAPTLKNTLTQTFGTAGVDGNIVDASPAVLFASTLPANADFLKLTAGSVALDMGENSLIPGLMTDIIGQSRIRNTNVDLGGFEFQTGNFPLPVSLIAFNAIKNSAKSVLTWKTASEQNNQKFVIERGSTATNFTFLKEVVGSGNSSSPTNYSIIDYNPLAGANYYRLTQYDYNGKATVLGVEALTFELADDKLKIYPNPATAYVWVKVPSSSNGIVAINLISLTGKSILSNTYVNTASKEIKLGLANIPTGTYVLWVNKGKIGEGKQILLVVK